MKRRVVRVNFRLTFQEEEMVKELTRVTHSWSLSELCRMALRQMYAREHKPPSDNGVIQPIAVIPPVRTYDKPGKKSPRSAEVKREKAKKS